MLWILCWKTQNMSFYVAIITIQCNMLFLQLFPSDSCREKKMPIGVGIVTISHSLVFLSGKNSHEISKKSQKISRVGTGDTSGIEKSSSEKKRLILTPLFLSKRKCL